MQAEFLNVPRLRIWHLLGLAAAVASLLAANRLRNEQNYPALRTLREARSADVATRREAVASLGSLDSRQPDPVPTLLTALDDEDIWVRRYAIRSLLMIVLHGGQGIIDNPREQQVRTGLLRLLFEPDSMENMDAAYALVTMNDHSRRLRNRLIKLAFGGTHEGAETRIQALDYLSSFRPDQMTATFVVEIMDDTNPKIREAAASCIGSWGFKGAKDVPDFALQALIEGLDDKEPGVSDSSARGLSYMRSRALPALAVFVRLMDHPEPERRRRAVRELVNLNIYAEPALPALRAMIDHDPDHDVRNFSKDSARWIEKALQTFRERTLPELISKLGSNEPVRRHEAVQELGEYGPPAAPAVPALLRLMSDPIAQVRQAAETALRQIEPEEKSSPTDGTPARN